MLLVFALMVARFGFGKVAFAASVVVHASVAVIAVRQHGLSAPSAPVAPSVEVAAPDLLSAEAEVERPTANAEPQRAPSEPTPNVAVRAARVVAPSAATATEDLAPAPSVVTAPEPSAPHFTMLVAAVSTVVPGATATAGHAVTAGGFSEAPIAESAADVGAKLRTGAPPAYTTEALAAGVESDVPLELVVDASGAVVSARPLTHVGYGLDEAALRSAQNYRFSPAQRGGHPVAVRMRWVMRFQLR